jgi:FemAB family protein
MENMKTMGNNALKVFDLVLTSVGLEAKYRRDLPGDWTAVSVNVDYLPVNYSETSIDYITAYWLGNGFDFNDLSLVLYNDKQPVGIWPLSVTCGDAVRLGSNGELLQPPIFDPRLPLKSVKRIVAACLDLVDAFCRKNLIPTWESKESLPDKLCVTEWHIQTMQRGAEAALRHDLFIDLSLDMAAIKSRFRESFKSLVTSGKKHFQAGLLNQQGGEEIWREFRLLHLAVAGRSTRSENSWDLQYRGLLKGGSFLVYLRDHAGRMVGGALFNITRDEGFYAVGAYDRTLFDKPVGHVIQYEAIQEMRRLGLRWYHIGARSFPDELPLLTEKQAAILHFKSGFATHTLPRFVITRKLASQNE